MNLIIAMFFTQTLVIAELKKNPDQIESKVIYSELIKYAHELCHPANTEVDKIMNCGDYTCQVRYSCVDKNNKQ